MKKRQRKKEYKKNRNRNVIVPLIPVKVNQKEKKDIRKWYLFFCIKIL